jgi:hypothetical protein
MLRGRNFPRAALGDVTDNDTTCAWRRSVSASAGSRMTEELENPEDDD